MVVDETDLSSKPFSFIDSNLKGIKFQMGTLGVLGALGTEHVKSVHNVNFRL